MRIIWWVYPVNTKIHNQDNRIFFTGKSKKEVLAASSVKSSSVQLTFVLAVLAEPDKENKKPIIVLIAKLKPK